MSEKAVEVAQAFLQELIEIVGEKPALAKRLVEAIEYRLVSIPIDPLVVYREEGQDGTRKKLGKLNADALRVLIRQHHIPCKDIGRRKKPELIDVVLGYAANTDLGNAAEAAE